MITFDRFDFNFNIFVEKYVNCINEYVLKYVIQQAEIRKLLGCITHDLLISIFRLQILRFGSQTFRFFDFLTGFCWTLVNMAFWDFVGA